MRKRYIERMNPKGLKERKARLTTRESKAGLAFDKKIQEMQDKLDEKRQHLTALRV